MNVTRRYHDAAPGWPEDEVTVWGAVVAEVVALRVVAEVVVPRVVAEVVVPRVVAVVGPPIVGPLVVTTAARLAVVRTVGLPVTDVVDRVVVVVEVVVPAEEEKEENDDDEASALDWM